MAYRVEIGSKADEQFTKLDAAISASAERKIAWLAENAAAVVHRRLVGMPEELAGLCKLRVGDWRVLDWNYPAGQIEVSAKSASGGVGERRSWRKRGAGWLSRGKCGK